MEAAELIHHIEVMEKYPVFQSWCDLMRRHYLGQEPDLIGLA